MKQLMFSGKGTNLNTGKEIRFEIPATMSHKGLETALRNVRIDEVRVGDSAFRRPDPFVEEILDRALAGMKKRDDTLQEYCDIMSRRLEEVLMLKGFPKEAARFEFSRITVDGVISISPRLCVNEEIVKTPEQISAFMELVREDMPREFPEFTHTSEYGKGASA